MSFDDVNLNREKIEKAIALIGYLGLNIDDMQELIRFRDDFIKSVYAPSVYASLIEL